MAERSSQLGLNFLQLISRFPLEEPDRRNESDNEFNKYAEEHDSGIWVTGRSVLNLWRIMNQELKLSSFDRGHIVQQVLHKRFPSYSSSILKKWFYSASKRSRALSYIYQLAEINTELMVRYI